MENTEDSQAQVAIGKILQRIQKRDQPVNPTSSLEDLRLLKKYECWEPFLELAERAYLIDSSERLEICRLYLEVLNKEFHNFEKVGKLLSWATGALKLGLREVSESLLPNIMIKDNPKNEAKILEILAQSFSSSSDRVGCLEKIALIYEKQLHDDEALAKTYEDILKLNPENLRALRYFKVLFAQANEWDKVAEILERLLLVTTHKKEEIRFAFELAALYLYNFSEPKKTLDILHKYCQDTELDSSTLEYDACHSLKDWQGCVRVLSAYLEKISTPREQAVVFYRKGKLLQLLGKQKEACDFFYKASATWPEFLEPIEALIFLALKQKNWEEVLSRLKILIKHMHSTNPKEKLEELIHSLEDCLKHASRL